MVNKMKDNLKEEINYGHVKTCDNCGSTMFITDYMQFANGKINILVTMCGKCFHQTYGTPFIEKEKV